MSKTILLADDSVTIRKVVELTFMDENYDLISVGSGSEALDRLEPGVALVIADVHMPGADGYEVCKEVKQRYPQIPVMLLVGTFESYDEVKAEAVGADDHLKKPFDSQDLLSRVRELVAGSSSSTTPFEQPFGPSEGSFGADPAPSEDVVEQNQVVAPVAAEVDAISDAQPSEPSSIAELSDETVDRIARRVVELLSEEAIRDVAWEVIPDLAEVVIKERLSELESQVE